MRAPIYYIFYFALAFYSTIPYAHARLRGGGTLKVRISRFLNTNNKLYDGNCCSMYQSDEKCWGSCRTFFRICTTYNVNPSILRKTPKFPMNLSSLLATADLSKPHEISGAAKKQPFYRQTKRNYTIESSESTTIHLDRSNAIDDSPSYVFSTPNDEWYPGLRNVEETDVENPNPFFPCTFGVVVTEVVAGSSLEAEKDGILEVAFPFKAPWPLTFRLIIEAWNEGTGYASANSGDVVRMERNKTGVLISRHESRHTLQGNDDWKPLRYEVGDGKTIHYSLRVSCNTPFFGKKCSMRCDSSRASKYGRVNCTDDENGQVSCLEGWTGDYCNKAICRVDCHSIHGYCTQPGECKCALGWRGKNCDECVPLPGCKHGFCSNTSYECICEPGWEGNYCATPICSEGCHSVRGYCKTPGECRCRVGWDGESCEACKPLPGCANGYCKRPLECRCRTGWSGTLCNKPICKTNCSAVHGSCENPGECRCDIGWWGDNCNTCFPYPDCKHGSCEKPWECNCKHGWTGMTCSERKEMGDSYCDTHLNTCLNGGTCINTLDDRNYTCRCPTSFTGQQCGSSVQEKTSFFPKIKRDFLAARSSFSTPTPTSTSSSFRNFVNDEPIKATMGSNSPQPNITDHQTGAIMSVSISKSVSMSTSPMISNSKVPGETNNKDAPNKIHLDVAEAGLQRNEELSDSRQGKITDAIRVENLDKTIHEQRKPLIALRQNKLDLLDNRSIHDETPQQRVSHFITQEGESPLNEGKIYFGEDISPIYPKDTEESTPSLDYTDIANEDPKEGELLFEIPFAEELYVEILRALGVKLTENSIRPTIQTPMIILQVLDHRTFDDNNEYEDSEVNNLNLQQIPEISRFLPHYDSVGLATDDHPSSLPFTGSQKDIRESNFLPNPFRPETDSYALNRVSPRGAFEHLAPKTRINRRTGLLPDFESFSTARRTSALPATQSATPKDIPAPTERPRQPKSYYEENYNGRVHIGDVSEVDRDAPVEEIQAAFIELKKLHS